MSCTLWDPKPRANICFCFCSKINMVCQAFSAYFRTKSSWLLIKKTKRKKQHRNHYWCRCQNHVFEKSLTIFDLKDFNDNWWVTKKFCLHHSTCRSHGQAVLLRVFLREKMSIFGQKCTIFHDLFRIFTKSHTILGPAPKAELYFVICVSRKYGWATKDSRIFPPHTVGKSTIFLRFSHRNRLKIAKIEGSYQNRHPTKKS